MNRLASVRCFLVGNPRKSIKSSEVSKPVIANPLIRVKPQLMASQRTVTGRLLKNMAQQRQQNLIATATKQTQSQLASHSQQSLDKPFYNTLRRQMFATQSNSMNKTSPSQAAPVTSPNNDNQTKNPSEGQKGDVRTRANRYETEVQALEGLAKDGYKLQFRINNDGKLKVHDGEKEVEGNYSVDQVDVVEFHRFEGASNPSDMSIIYALKTNDGKKGTLHVPFGSGQENEHTGDFVRQLNLKQQSKK